MGGIGLLGKDAQPIQWRPRSDAQIPPSPRWRTTWPTASRASTPRAAPTTRPTTSTPLGPRRARSTGWPTRTATSAPREPWRASPHLAGRPSTRSSAQPVTASGWRPAARSTGCCPTCTATWWAASMRPRRPWLTPSAGSPEDW